jgi:hypothetical protein
MVFVLTIALRRVFAHEIPPSVVVLAFVKPDRTSPAHRPGSAGI